MILLSFQNIQHCQWINIYQGAINNIFPKLRFEFHVCFRIQMSSEKNCIVVYKKNFISVQIMFVNCQQQR